MVDEIVPLQLGGVELLVEVTSLPRSEETAGTLDRAQEAIAQASDRAQEAIVAVAVSTMDTITQLGRRSVRPDEMEVKFGLKFSAQGNVIVAGAAGEASLEVTLTYRHDTDEHDDTARQR